MLRLPVLLTLALALPVFASSQTALQAPPKNAAMAPPLPALPHATLDRIHAANAVVCGVVKEEEDYSRNEDHGNRAAFDIDLCKAVSVALLGPGARLVVKSYPDEPFSMRALKSGEVDLVATASLNIPNMTTDVALSAPVLLDSQGMLFPNNPAVHSLTDLAGKKVCFLTGSAAEEGLHGYAEVHGITYIWYPFSEAGEMEAAFFTGNCDAVTGDMTQLANIRGIDEHRSAEFTILPESMREDPLAVATWAGDPGLGAVVFWTVQTLLDAEQLGITRDNVASLRDSKRSAVQQLLGQGLGAAASLKVRARWGAEVIAAVGNYGELYERDLGTKSAMRLDRGKNRLTTQGGGLYAVPVRDR